MRLPNSLFARFVSARSLCLVLTLLAGSAVWGDARDTARGDYRTDRCARWFRCAPRLWQRRVDGSLAR